MVKSTKVGHSDPKACYRAHSSAHFTIYGTANAVLYGYDVFAICEIPMNIVTTTFLGFVFSLGEIAK